MERLTNSKAIGALTYLRPICLHPSMSIEAVGVRPRRPRSAAWRAAPTPACAASVPAAPHPSLAPRAVSAASPRASARRRSGVGPPRWSGRGRVPSPSQGSAGAAQDRLEWACSTSCRGVPPRLNPSSARSRERGVSRTSPALVAAGSPRGYRSGHTMTPNLASWKGDVSSALKKPGFSRAARARS